MSQLEECPRCGNTKHHEIVRIDDKKGKESEMFRCKACGYLEYHIEDDSEKTEKAVDRMGDAFREYLRKKKEEGP